MSEEKFVELFKSAMKSLCQRMDDIHSVIKDMKDRQENFFERVVRMETELKNIKDERLVSIEKGIRPIFVAEMNREKVKFYAAAFSIMISSVIIPLVIMYLKGLL